MSDYYRELSGSPGYASPAFEVAVEAYLAAFPAELARKTLWALEDLLGDLEPDRDDEDATEAFAEAVRQFRDELTPPAALPLDPFPYYCVEGRTCRHSRSLSPSTHFKPRKGYSQTREDYPA